MSEVNNAVIDSLTDQTPPPAVTPAPPADPALTPAAPASTPTAPEAPTAPKAAGPDPWKVASQALRSQDVREAVEAVETIGRNAGWSPEEIRAFREAIESQTPASTPETPPAKPVEKGPMDQQAFNEAVKKEVEAQMAALRQDVDAHKQRHMEGAERFIAETIRREIDGPEGEDLRRVIGLSHKDKAAEQVEKARARITKRAYDLIRSGELQDDPKYRDSSVYDLLEAAVKKAKAEDLETAATYIGDIRQIGRAQDAESRLAEDLDKMDLVMPDPHSLRNSEEAKQKWKQVTEAHVTKSVLANSKRGSPQF